MGRFRAWYKASPGWQKLLTLGSILLVSFAAVQLDGGNGGSTSEQRPSSAISPVAASYVAEYGGVESVYSRILNIGQVPHNYGQMTDCNDLQREFD